MAKKLYSGSIGILVKVTITSLDTGYAFGDVTAADLIFTRSDGVKFVRVGTFAVVLGKLEVSYTTVAADLSVDGVLEIQPRLTRTAGVMFTSPAIAKVL